MTSVTVNEPCRLKDICPSSTSSLPSWQVKEVVGGTGELLTSKDSPDQMCSLSRISFLVPFPFPEGSLFSHFNLESSFALCRNPGSKLAISLSPCLPPCLNAQKVLGRHLFETNSHLVPGINHVTPQGYRALETSKFPLHSTVLIGQKARMLSLAFEG